MKIRNWRKFQHYKRRNPPWIKLHKQLLDDPEWFALSGDASKMLACCWLLASEHDGKLPPLKTVAFRLHMTEKRAAELISQLDQWLEHDASTMLAERKQVATPETETETEAEAEAEAEANASASLARKRASRLKEEWWPTKENVDYAIAKGLSIERVNVEAEKFRNYWTAKSGENATKVDWGATWRNWILNACERQPNGRHVNGNDRRPGESLGDLGRRLAAEAREHERSAGIGRADDPFRKH